MTKTIEFPTGDIIGGDESQSDVYVGLQDSGPFYIIRCWDGFWEQEDFHPRIRKATPEEDRKATIFHLAMRCASVLLVGKEPYRIFNGVPNHLAERTEGLEEWLSTSYGIQLNETKPLISKEFEDFQKHVSERYEKVSSYTNT